MDWFEDAKKMYIPGEFGYRQIAKALNMSVKTVEARFLREKKKGEAPANKLTRQHTQRIVERVCYYLFM